MEIDDRASESEDEVLSSEQSDAEILRIAKERFKIAVEAESETRRDELDDQRFTIGDQWPAEIKNQRVSDSRPCLTINRIPQFVNQVTNDQRQNRPSIKINPVDDKADIETAKVFQGLIRHIENNSHADIAYDTGFEAAVESGLGYFRIVTEYAEPMSFQQEIKIKLVKDRFSVHVDPFYQEPDGSDMNWGFISEDMPKEEYAAQYPDSKLSSMADWESLGDSDTLWVKANTAKVAEYYYRDYENVDIVLLSDQTVIKKKDLPETLPDGVRVISERKTIIPKVIWCKINGVEILEKTEIPESIPRGWVPIIPIIGKEKIVDGKRVLSGLVRYSKDPQRMYNYYASSATEMIALAPKAPFIGAEGQFEGHEEQWKTANTKNHAYLEYKTKSNNGTPVPAPQRTQFEPQVQAITNERMQSSEELKATTGIYDATLGNRSNEQSGVAIQRRNSQAQTSNFHFMDNLSRALRHAGRILVNWIPKVYDTAQVIRTIGTDGEVEMVQINQVFKEGRDEKSHFLDHGRYDVTVDTGPSYQTKRQEAVGSMIDLARALPQAMAPAVDILVRNMDWPGAQEIADRIKKTLPPNITEDDKNQQPLPAHIQQQMVQMSQMVKVLDEQNREMMDTIKNKKLELESKERIAMSEQENALKIEILKHDAKDAQIMLQIETDRIEKRLEELKFNQPIDNGGGGPMPAMPPENNPQQQPIGGPEPAGMGDQS